MKWKHSLILIIACFSQFSFAQQNNASDNSSFGFDRTIGGYVYLDPLSIAFGDQTIAFESAYDMSTYKLGAGDIISINIKAIEPILLRGLAINPEGKIVTPILGQISLKGLTFSEAEEIVKEVALETFSNLEVDISLEKPRPLVVFINGDIPHSGKHTIPPFSRVDEAIFPSLNALEIDPVTKNQIAYKSTSDILNSGPYSFRNILLVTNNSDSTLIDLYSFYKNGDLTNNPFINDGDKVFIYKLDNSSNKISISGAIANSVELEFNFKDTPEQIINLAGGLKNDASDSELYVYRSIEDSIDKILVSKQDWSSFQLEPNDRIVVPKVSKYNANAVAHIYGEVNLPGTFPIISGTSNVLDLINYGDGLTIEALTTAAYLVRGSGIENQIANEFNLESMKRTSDQIAQGFSYLELETRNSRNRVYLDLSDTDELKNIKLYNQDRLFIPLDENTVFVFGQVNMSGFFPFDNTKSIANYIDRAGGFALSADRSRVFVLKAGNNTWYKPEDTILESGDKIFVDRKPYDELNALRTFEIQKAQERNTRIQLIMTGLTTITGIVTTYLAIENFRRN